MRIEPGWISAGLGVILAVAGFVSAWFRTGTHIAVHEKRIDRLEADVADGDARLSRVEREAAEHTGAVTELGHRVDRLERDMDAAGSKHHAR